MGKLGKKLRLTGDEVDVLVEHLRNRLNLLNGNITDEEYEILEDSIYTTLGIK